MKCVISNCLVCCRNGDHIHTNFRDMYLHLRANGYFIEVLGTFLWLRLIVGNVIDEHNSMCLFVPLRTEFVLSLRSVTHTHTQTTVLRLCGICPGQPG